MADINKIRDFVKNIHVDGRHEGEKVSTVGTFIEQQLQGVAKTAGRQYQFVVDDDLALVATVLDEFVPREGTRYLVTGFLRSTGLDGLFPGIEIIEIAEV